MSALKIGDTNFSNQREVNQFVGAMEREYCIISSSPNPKVGHRIAAKYEPFLKELVARTPSHNSRGEVSHFEVGASTFGDMTQSYIVIVHRNGEKGRFRFIDNLGFAGHRWEDVIKIGTETFPNVKAVRASYRAMLAKYRPGQRVEFDDELALFDLLHTQTVEAPVSYGEIDYIAVPKNLSVQDTFEIVYLDGWRAPLCISSIHFCQWESEEGDCLAIDEKGFPLNLAPGKSGVKIGSLIISGEKEAHKLYEGILKKHRRGQRIRSEHEPAIYALLDIYPHAVEVRGCGIDHFERETLYDMRNSSFCVVRRDGSRGRLDIWNINMWFTAEDRHRCYSPEERRKRREREVAF